MDLNIPVKSPTGIRGLDVITAGGLPDGRITLVTGGPGSGKTVFSMQYLHAGVELGEPGVFVTFEDQPAFIGGNVRSFGWDVAAMVDADMLRFVDVSAPSGGEGRIVGGFDLSALAERIKTACDEIGAKRVALDSLGALFARLGLFDPLERLEMRTGLRELAARLRALDVTTIMTSERTSEASPDLDYQLEEYVADNVLMLRNNLDGERRRRTVEVLKFRGAEHHEGQFAFSILPGSGIAVLPLGEMALETPSTEDRTESGSVELDAMLGGGMFRESVALVSGATGTGKTLVSSHFVLGGAARGDKVLLLAYEESRDQLFRNARGWGMDFDGLVASGQLRVECAYPEGMSLQRHLARITSLVDEYQPDRIVIDSLSALERAGSVLGFREFSLALVALVKTRGVLTLMTSSSAELSGSVTVTEGHISTLTDLILLLRYVEVAGEMRRGVAVLKMRGSTHDKAIREFTIDGEGMRIGRIFQRVGGIVLGVPHQVNPSLDDRLTTLFDDPPTADL